MLFLRFRQPPNSSSMVNNFSFGNAFSYFSLPQRRADGSSFSRQFPDLWRVEIFQVGFRHLFGAFFLATLSTTDTVGSARIDSLGVTFRIYLSPVHSLPAELRFPRRQYIANPALDKGVSGAARARTRTSTFLYSARTKSCAFA